MSTSTNTIRLTAHEEIAVVRRTDDVLEMDVRWSRGGDEPPPHRHPRQEEHFEVLEGSLRVSIDGKETVVVAGESFDVPRGAPHRMVAEGPTRARWEVRPALGTEKLFRAIAAAARGRDTPSPVRMIPLLIRYRAEFRLARRG